MSIYVVIGAGILELISISNQAIAAGILRAKSKNSKDANTKRSLLVASYFLGFSIIIGLIVMILAFKAATTSSCKKGGRRALIVFVILYVIFITIALVIAKVFKTKAEKADDQGSAAAMKAAMIQTYISIVLSAIAFGLFFIVVGRKVRKLASVCKKIPR